MFLESRMNHQDHLQNTESFRVYRLLLSLSLCPHNAKTSETSYGQDNVFFLFWCSLFVYYNTMRMEDLHIEVSRRMKHEGTRETERNTKDDTKYKRIRYKRRQPRHHWGLFLSPTLPFHSYFPFRFLLSPSTFHTTSQKRRVHAPNNFISFHPLSLLLRPLHPQHL